MANAKKEKEGEGDITVTDVEEDTTDNSTRMTYTTNDTEYSHSRNHPLTPSKRATTPKKNNTHSRSSAQPMSPISSTSTSSKSTSSIRHPTPAIRAQANMIANALMGGQKDSPEQPPRVRAGSPTAYETYTHYAQSVEEELSREHSRHSSQASIDSRYSQEDEQADEGTQTLPLSNLIHFVVVTLYSHVVYMYTVVDPDHDQEDVSTPTKSQDSPIRASMTPAHTR